MADFEGGSKKETNEDKVKDTYFEEEEKEEDIDDNDNKEKGKGKLMNIKYSFLFF